VPVSISRIIRRRDDRIERLADHQPFRQVQQLLGKRIGVCDPMIGIDDHHRHRQCGEEFREPRPIA
jgi:hypothetical protein